MCPQMYAMYYVCYGVAIAPACLLQDLNEEVEAVADIRAGGDHDLLDVAFLPDDVGAGRLATAGDRLPGEGQVLPQRSRVVHGQDRAPHGQVLPSSLGFHYFSVSLLRFRKNRPSHCRPIKPEKGVLLICASGFDWVTIYMKLMRELEIGLGECEVPEVYVLKRNRPLTLGSEENINKYAFQIGEIIKYMTIEEELEITIFTHEEGAFLTLTYLTRRAINLLFTNILEKIRSLVLVDIAQPFIRIMHDPPHRAYNRLKQEIFADRQRVGIFNKLKIIVINTYKEDERLSRFQLINQNGEKFVFSNTLLLSSREMANVHYYLPSNSLSFPPFVRRIGQFITKNLIEQMDLVQIHNFFRHGESYAYEVLKERHLAECHEMPLPKFSQGIITSSSCVRMLAGELADNSTLALYSPNHFSMFAESGERIYPFDNLTEGSIFLLQAVKEPLYILNPESHTLYIAHDAMITPKNPLTLTDDQIYGSSQILFTNYSVISVCPNMKLFFPMHFAQRNAQRKFLVPGQGDCFSEDSLLEEFSWPIFLHWSLFRNIIIFTLLCSEYRRQHLSDRLIQQYCINMLLLMAREEVESKFFYTLYIVSFGLMMEYMTRGLLKLCSRIRLREKLGNTILLFISALCLLGSALGVLNVWYFFLLSMLLFINEESILIVIIKLYFLKEEIWHNGTSFGLSEIGLLTMWIYTALPSNRLPSQAFWTVQRIFSGLLLVGTALSLQSSGNFMNNLVTIYMKVLIVVKMLRIIRR